MQPPASQLPVELVNSVLQRVEDPHLLLYLESVSHEMHAARFVLPGECCTTIGSHWASDIESVSRLAALYTQLDRVVHLKLKVDTIPEHFFSKARHLESLALTGLQGVPACLGELTRLTELTLRGHFLSLPETIAGLQQLQHLSITSSMPDWLHSFELPGAVTQLQRLQTLTLNIDGAVVWPTSSAAAGQQLTSLTKLMLHNPTGAMVQKNLPGLPSLKELHVTGYEVASMRLTSLLHPGLELLHISFNDAGAFGHGGLLDMFPGATQQQLALNLSGLKTLQLEAFCIGLHEVLGAVDPHDNNILNNNHHQQQQQQMDGDVLNQGDQDNLGIDLLHIEPPQHLQPGGAVDAAAAAVALVNMFDLLTALTRLELTIRPSTAHPAHNAWQQLYHALPHLKGLQQLQLVGASELPAGHSSSSLAALTRLEQLELINRSNSSSTSSTRRLHSSSSVDQFQLVLPASLAQLSLLGGWWLPVDQLQQLLTGLPLLQRLVLSQQQAEQAGVAAVLQQLQALGCQVQVERVSG